MTVHSVSLNNDAHSAACSPSGITPKCIQTLYGVPTTLAKSSKNQLAVSGFIEQHAQQKDLTACVYSGLSDNVLKNEYYAT